MAALLFSITAPSNGAVVGRNISVRGRARIVGGSRFPHVGLESIEVTFSDGGLVTPVAGTNGEWRFDGSPAPTTTGGSPLRIFVVVRTVVTADEESVPESFEEVHPIDVTLESGIPETLTIDAFTSPVTPDSLPYHLDLAGAAGDALSGIRSVAVQVGGGAFVDAVDVGGGFARWSRPLDLPAGEHHFTVRALDRLGNKKDATARLTVTVPTDPSAVDEIFRPTRYLRELVAFAGRYVEVDGSTNVLTPAMLADRFHQPFDRLSEISMAAAATRSVAQARIAVEVLRGRLGSAASQQLEQRHRALAYRTLVQQTGTSYDELRLARNAGPAARGALAVRLGITLAATRPDRLDELTIVPEQVSEQQLEALFGYRSTAADDPLTAPPTDAAFSLWRRDALAARWVQEDATQRDSAAGPLPIIDPDIIGEGHVRSQQTEDPAFSLLTARRQWVGETQAKIEAAARAGGDPLTRFDELVLTYVGPLDVADLTARDADGIDVGTDLAAVNLDLNAFRFLARCRDLLVDGAVLDTEMQDIVSILLQAQKLREYRQWRLEERRASIVLAPASFVADPADGADPTDATTPRDISPWRVKPSDHAEWRRTLEARAAAARGG